VPLVAGEFGIADLVKRALIQRYERGSTLKKMKAAAGLFSGAEKSGCHEIAVRNPNVIDAEIAFPGVVSLEDGGDDKKAPRVDLAALEAHDGEVRLVFWEAKHYGNGELRAVIDNPPPVCRQIDIYRKFLVDNREAIERRYTRVAENLTAIHRMGSKRPLSPLIPDVAAGKRRLTLGETPKVGLIIFGFDSGQRDQPGWKAHLQRLKAAIPYIQAKGDAKAIRL